LFFLVFFHKKNVFDEVNGKIDSMGPDIFETFIYPQLLIGTWAGYTAISLYRKESGYNRVRYKALKYRYMYGAAKDVMMAYENLGWVSPIFSSEKTIPPMLLPEEVDLGEEGNHSLVYYSVRTDCRFATNIPALIKLLIFWLSRQSKLKAKILIKKSGKIFIDKIGNLRARDEIEAVKLNWFRMKVYHEDMKVDRSIPEALLSLVTDGKHDDEKNDGITFENLLLDVGFSTQEALVTRITDMMAEKREDFARRNIVPSTADVHKNIKEMEKDDAARGVLDGSSDEDVDDESEEVSTESKDFPLRGHFEFKQGELKKIFNNKEEDVTPEEVRTNLDAMISVHAEKLVRLSLARAAQSRIDSNDDDHEKFSGSYIQSKEQQKGESDAILNGFSNDICWFLSAVCGWCLDTAIESRPIGRTLSPLEAVCAVRDGDIPLFMTRNYLALTSSCLLGDNDAGKKIHASADSDNRTYLQALAQNNDAVAKSTDKEVSERTLDFLRAIEENIRTLQSHLQKTSDKGDGGSDSNSPKVPPPALKKGDGGSADMILEDPPPASKERDDGSVDSESEIPPPASQEGDGGSEDSGSDSSAAAKAKVVLNSPSVVTRRQSEAKRSTRPGEDHSESQTKKRSRVSEEFAATEAMPATSAIEVDDTKKKPSKPSKASANRGRGGKGTVRRGNK